MNCHLCKTECIKKGFQKNGSQKYYCKVCKLGQQLIYRRNAYHPCTNNQIVRLIKIGCSDSGIQRFLKISVKTVGRRILKMAAMVKPSLISRGKEYEMDEMCTYIGHKKNKYWLAYAINKRTGKPVSFYLGKRTNKTLRAVINTLLLSGAKRIYTDGFKNYRYLIPKILHKVEKHGTVNIERNNLNLRTNFKPLQRKTICFSRSLTMMNARLKIWFWEGEKEII